VARREQCPSCSRSRRGFTLVELLVALLVGAITVLGARMMLEGVADSERRLSRATQRAEREANGERVLRATVASIEVGTPGTLPFAGDEREANFTSWCDRAGGWQERCAATVAIAPAGVTGATSALVLTDAGAGALRLRTGFTHGELRYLIDARDGGQWVTSWAAGVGAPLAIGVVFDADTLILRIGQRG
jgi:prepilin-type N-terminal cleavage/methylation domain-containing protein